MQDSVEVSAVGVGQENLSELIAAGQTDYLFNPVAVEFVENVVEKEQRRLAPARFFEQGELGQFQGDEVGLALPLRPFFFNGKSSELHDEVILVDAV